MQTYARTPDLLDLVKQEITLQAIGSVAAELGEETERTASAVSVGVPSVLNLLSEVASSPNGAAHLEAAIDAKSPEASAREPVLLDGRAGQRAAGFLDRELGSRVWDVSDEMSRSSGIRRESAHTLVGGVASVTLLALARNLGSMSSATLRELLIAQRGEWRTGEPEREGRTFAGRVGVAETTPARVRAAPAIRPQARTRRRRGWLLPVLLLAAAIVAIPVILGLGRRYQQPIPTPQSTEEPSPRAVTPAPQAAAPEPTVPAPSQNAAPSATTPASADLAGFLGSNEGTLPRRFPLALRFDDDATLPTTSTAALDDVAAALRAHPSAQIRLESTAGGVGATAESNQALAQSRSEAVKDWLVAHGIDGERISAAVMSPDVPAGNANASEGRADARVDLIVVSR